MTAATSAWPPDSGLTTINVPRDATVLHSFGKTRINAPADVVFEILRKVNEYNQWNNFCPKVTIHKQPNGEKDGLLHEGTHFTLHVIMDEKKPRNETPTQLMITDISTPTNPSEYVPKNIREKEDCFYADLETLYRISWKCEGGFASRGLKTERFHEVVVLGPTECEVRTWENQGGVLAHTVKWMYKQTLQKKFQVWCDDLKKVCEEKAKGNS